MNILQKHKGVTQKANIYYHKFLNRYKKTEKVVYIFCEGNVDLGYYGQAIKRIYSGISIAKFFVEGKNNVLAIHDYLDWSYYDKNQILFFVDRDMSYWLSDSIQYEQNIYITDEYSFENDAVKEDFFIYCLEDLYGFACATNEEKDIIKQFYKYKWESFFENSKYIMAAVAISLKYTGEHLAKEIDNKKIIRIARETVWVSEIDNEPLEDYIDKKLKILEDYKEEIFALINRFNIEKDHFSVRGKWAITFFVKALEYIMNNGEKFAPSMYKGDVKIPKRMCEITPDNAMVILGPRMEIPKTLREFCTTHITTYLKGCNAN